jgi:hypothetical protein
MYEYIAVYVDDLAIAMKNPKEFTDILENPMYFTYKIHRKVDQELRKIIRYET